MNDALRRAALYGAAAALVGGGAFGLSRLREAAPLNAPEAGSVVEGKLGRRLIHEALRAEGLGARESAALADAAGGAIDARRLRPDDRYRLVRGPDGSLLHFTLTRGAQRAVVTPGADGGLRAAMIQDPVSTAERRAGGEINGNLWFSMESAGVPPEVIVRYAETFQWTVDFLSESRDGDRFAVVWNEHSSAGRPLGRTVRAGAYDGREAGERTAILFDGEYFDASGASLRRKFLRAPLRFARVSSPFNRKRKHPILRINRPHHGTDYAAATGTPVTAVADGIVTAAHRERGFGNVVKIRHDGIHTTLYAHLSRFSAGARKGARVRQGRVIGYVGSTGLATGPHLHFQIEERGRWADFLSLNLPFARSVDGGRRSAFKAERDRLMPGLGRL